MAYGEPLAADGVMFRGTPPPLWRTDLSPGEASGPYRNPPELMSSSTGSGRILGYT